MIWNVGKEKGFKNPTANHWKPSAAPIKTFKYSTQQTSPNFKWHGNSKIEINTSYDNHSKKFIAPAERNIKSIRSQSVTWEFLECFLLILAVYRVPGWIADSEIKLIFAKQYECNNNIFNAP